MKIDADEILASLETEASDKKPASIYVSEALMDKFKAACGGKPHSRVIEKLMEAFIKSAEQKA